MWVFRIAFLKKKSIKRDLNREERPQYQTILNLNSNRKTNLTWSNEMERPAGMKAALASSLEDIRENAESYYVDGNYEEAVKWYRKLAIKGDTTAQQMVASLEKMLMDRRLSAPAPATSAVAKVTRPPPPP